MERLYGYITAVGILGIIVFGSGRTATGQTQEFDFGTINWRQQVVRAIGIGAPDLKQPRQIRRAMAVRAAKMVAARNALEMVQGMHLTSETTVRNFMTESDVIRTKVDGVVRGGQYGEPAYYEDGSVEVEIIIPLTGLMTEALVYTRTGPGMPAMGVQTSVSGGWIPPEASTAQPSAAPDQAYTGLIVDARGLGVRPALSPRILGVNGAEYYSATTVTKEFALKMGVSGYAKDPEVAKQDARVGSNPLIIKAMGAAGTNKTDVVITEPDALLVKQINEAAKFLAECRLIILVD